MATMVLTVVTPDSVQATKDLLVTTPQTGAVTEFSSIRNIGQYFQAIADGAIANTSVTITSIS